jgi:hypothetical protein
MSDHPDFPYPKLLIASISQRPDVAELNRKIQGTLAQKDRQIAELWKKIEQAIPSVRRDLARCGTLGNTEEYRRYKHWLDDLARLRERGE